MKLRELVVLGACAFAGSAAVHMVFFGGDSTQAEGEADKGTVVKANRFELLDKGGKVRGHFSMGENGQPNLWLADTNGNMYPQLGDMTGMELVGELRKAIKTLAEKEEHKEERVKVEHILIAFKGASRSTSSRSFEEAEALAAKLYKKVLDGADFSKLRKEHSNDPGAGIYTMVTKNGAAGEFLRTQMSRNFGDVSWRLKVGEVGIAEYNAEHSGFGIHIIKRLQ